MPCHVHVPGTQAPTIVQTCPQQAAPVPRAHEVGAAAVSSFAPPITLQPACSVVPQSSATAHDITARIIADVTARNADNTTSQTSANTDARTVANKGRTYIHTLKNVDEVTEESGQRLCYVVSNYFEEFSLE